MHIYVIRLSKLTELTRIVQGTKFSGNDTLARIGDLQFRQWGNQAARVVGADGILQLYNQSNFVSDELVDAQKDVTGTYLRGQ
ncbi:hypothetical protein L3X07_13035 [Levilactobacillus brevis]|nr:hypothetical protein [Levilactobacillus brevis]